MTLEIRSTRSNYAPVWDVARVEETAEQRTTRLWLALAASTLFVSSTVTFALAFTATPLFLLGAIPLLAGFGGVVAFNYTWIDFDNPKELEAVRQKAASMSLPDIIERFHWDKLFKYAIVTPEQFEKDYKTYASGKSLSQIIDFYETAVKELSQVKPAAPFAIPHPLRWHHKFAQETAAMSCSEIASRYHPSVAQLCQYEFLSPDQKTLLLAAKKVYSEIGAYEQKCQAEYRREVAPQEEIRNRTKELARLSYESHSAHHLLTRLDEEKRQELREVDKWAEETLKLGADPVRVATQKQERISDTTARFKRLKNECETLLENERKKKDLAYKWADRTFDLSTTSEREERDSKIQSYKAIRAPDFSMINAAYARVC